MVSSAAWRGGSKPDLVPAASCSYPAQAENLAAAGFSGHPPPCRAGCKDCFAAVQQAELSAAGTCCPSCAGTASLLPSPTSLGKPWRPGNAVGGAGCSDQLRRMVIPAPPGQARGNAKGGWFGTVILAGGSAHPKGNIFWRQMPGYQSMCREGWIPFIAGPSLPLGTLHHFLPHWAS